MNDRQIMVCRKCSAELGFNNVEMESGVKPVTCAKCGTVNNIQMDIIKDDNRSAVVPEVEDKSKKKSKKKKADTTFDDKELTE